MNNNTLSTIGERIRRLRRIKNITQAELAGNDITRNMLSRIETGAALPSLPTLVLLAERLEVPAGILLEEKAYFDYLRADLVREAKEFMLGHEYAKALELIMTSGLKGDEIQLLIIECDLALARECSTTSKYKEASLLLADAVNKSQDTIYSTAGSAYISNLYLSLAQRLGKSLVGQEKAQVSPPDFDKYMDIYIYLKLTDLFDSGQIIKAVNLASLCEISDKILSAHVAALLDMANGRYNDAESKLKGIIASEAKSPTPHGSLLLFRVYDELEQCAKGENDYVSAYQYKEQKLKLYELASGIKL